VVWKKRVRVVLLSILVFGIFAYLGWWWQENVRHGKYQDLIPALYIIGFVKINYYQPVDSFRLMKVYLETGSIARTLKSLNDPYTELLSQDDFTELRKETNGYFDGIGIYLQKDEPVIWKVASGTPSEKAGLRAGDRIIEVDHIPVKSSPAAINKIKGKAGAKVLLRVVRNERVKSKIYDIQVTRAKIYIPTIQMKVLNDPILGKYAFLKIDQFSDTTAPDLEKKLTTIDKLNECRGLILDLRANPGGLLDAAVDIAGYFLPKGTPVLYIYKRGQLVKVAKTNKLTVHKQLPIVILVDYWSASAAEILAGALKDQKRAILVGTATFGKDLIQEVKELPGGMGFKITVYNYLTSGRINIHKRGVQPTQIVGESLNMVLKKGDTVRFLKIQALQEQAALQILRNQVLKHRDIPVNSKLAG
jgi:carboxyl-terminal processing protease